MAKIRPRKTREVDTSGEFELRSNRGNHHDLDNKPNMDDKDENADPEDERTDRVFLCHTLPSIDHSNRGFDRGL